jgi:hypothetical protein
MIFKGDVIIDILKHRRVDQWGATTDDVFTPGSDELSTGLGGYGRTISTTKVQFLRGAVEAYVPAGTRAGKTDFDTSEVTTRAEYIVPGDEESKIKPPDPLKPGANFAFPILNIDYVLINGNPPDVLIS